MLENHCPMYRDSKCVFTGRICDLSCQLDHYGEDEFKNLKGKLRPSEKKDFFWTRDTKDIRSGNY